VISVDTSVVVRHLVGTPEALARRATAVIEGDGVVGISVVVLLETAHVLRTQYDVPRSDVLEALIGLITRDNVELIGFPRTAVIAALARARSLPGTAGPGTIVAGYAATRRPGRGQCPDSRCVAALLIRRRAGATRHPRRGAIGVAGVDEILDGLNEAQRKAVTTVSGPVAIIAGAGSGKTRVVSHRAAYAVATGVVDERQILLVTFTEKAAREMAERVRGLGLGRVMARTFHSAALAQLRHFWPLRYDGAELPDVMADKWRIVSPLARSLPGGYRFTPARDLMDEIEWAKSRRLTPDTYEARAVGRTPPTTMDLFVRLFRDYERTKARRGLIDFDDILGLTVGLLEEDEEAAFSVRSRYAWFTVDEYQDTTPLYVRGGHA